MTTSTQTGTGGPRWTLAQVRGQYADKWRKVLVLATRVEDAYGAPLEGPHLEAVNLARMLPRAPYVSIAIDAHAAALAALREELHDSGCCEENLARLVNALFDVMDGTGLMMCKGQWQDRFPGHRTTMNAIDPSPPMLVWDVDGLVEEKP